MRRAAALAGLSVERAGELADPLRGAGILAPGARLACLHPILRAAVEAHMVNAGRFQVSTGRLSRRVAEGLEARFSGSASAAVLAAVAAELAMRGDDEALTPSERRVARMAAQGMTNRRIAEALS